MDEIDKALLDADAVLEVERGSAVSHMLRAKIFIARKETAKARIEAEAILLCADKTGEYAYDSAARILEKIGDRAGALAIMRIAVTKFPKAGNFLAISQVLAESDFAGRRAGIETVLKLEPSSTTALLLLVQLELEAKQWGDSIQAAKRALDYELTKRERLLLMVQRGVGYAKMGEMKLANADFEAATLMAKRPVELNNICYEIAKNDVAPKVALANCDRSLKQAPEVAHTLDSKAFTLMRLKRYADALTVYDAALKADGKLAEAWYGRGVAKYRLHNQYGGQADIRAALAINPDIGEEFARLALVP